MQKHNKILIGILILAVILRITFIGKESFWLDESATALALKQNTLSSLASTIMQKGDILPEYYKLNGVGFDMPVYYLLTKFWVMFFGLNEITLRMFSALFGILSVYTIYIIAKTLFNRRVALYSAYLSAISFVLIEYSQEARLYSFLVYITLLSLYLMLKKRYFWMGFINILGIYTSPLFLSTLAIDFLYLFFKNKKIAMALVGYSLLVYTPLIPRFIHPKYVSTHLAGTMTIAKLAKMFVSFNTYTSSGLSFIIISIALTGVFMWMFFKSFVKIKFKEGFLLYLWLIIPILMAFTLLFKTLSSFATIRYFIIAYPAYIILIAYGISTLYNKDYWLVAQPSTWILILITLLTIPIGFKYYHTQRNPDYRNVVNLIDTNEVIVSIPSVRVPLKYYGNIDARAITDIAYPIPIGDFWLVLSTKYAKTEVLGFYGARYIRSKSIILKDITMVKYDIY